MKILIAGATGLIGQEIVAQCHAQNIEVHYLTTSKNKIKNDKNYKGFYWNTNSQEIDLNCFTGVTAIINLAGVSIANRWTKSTKQKILNSRLNAIKTIKKGLLKVDSSEITSFVIASAIGVYPNSVENLYTEDATQVDQSFLGEVVQALETELQTLQQFSFNTVALRVGLVLSENGGALPQMAQPIKNFVGSIFGNGNQWVSWVHIHDIANMFLFVIKNNLSGVYNAVGPKPVPHKTMVKILAKVLKKPLLLPNIPKFVMRLVLGEMSYLLFSSQNVSSAKIQQVGFIFKYSTLEEALTGIYAK